MSSLHQRLKALADEAMLEYGKTRSLEEGALACILQATVGAVLAQQWSLLLVAGATLAEEGKASLTALDRRN